MEHRESLSPLDGSDAHRVNRLLSRYHGIGSQESGESSGLAEASKLQRAHSSTASRDEEAMRRMLGRVPDEQRSRLREVASVYLSGGRMMEPYYQDSLVTIYNAEWREVLPSLSGVDLVLADPPYGVDLNTEYRKAQRGNRTAANDYPPIYGDKEPFDPTPFLGYPGVILWGANYYADRLPPRGSWLVWDKRDGSGFNDQADAELAWVGGVSGTVPRLFAHRWNGMIKASEKDQRRVHPSQKPIALMGWCLSFFPKASLVFDPFMGSGPVPRACKDRGIHCVAVEKVERYCEIAAERCRQETLFGEVA
jgi:hypothetical protein